MKITTNQDNTFVLQEIYNPITLKTNAGEEMNICMRDSGFEITYQGDKYYAKGGRLEKVKTNNTDQQCTCKFEPNGEPLIGGYARCSVHDPNNRNTDLNQIMDGLVYRELFPESNKVAREIINNIKVETQPVINNHQSELNWLMNKLWELGWNGFSEEEVQRSINIRDKNNLNNK